MTDLEICKRIAEIEGIENFETYHPIPNEVGFDYECEHYNPLTDDALCFRLMVKYKVELDFWQEEAEIYYCPEYDERNPVVVSVSNMGKPNKVICLAIIEVNKESPKGDL